MKRLLRLTQTGYGCVKGQKTTAEVLQALFDGLRTNGLGGYAKILTGYVPGAEALEVVEKEIRSLKAENPDTIYVLDRKSSWAEASDICSCLEQASCTKNVSRHGRRW